MFGVIPQNVWQHSRECLATFPGMVGNIPRNVWGHSPKCLATFPGMLGNIHRDVWRYSPECLATFPGMFGDIPEMFSNTPRNVWPHSLECLTTFPGMFGNIPRNITFPPFPAFLAFRSPFLYSWFYTSKLWVKLNCDLKEGLKVFILQKYGCNKGLILLEHSTFKGIAFTIAMWSCKFNKYLCLHL